MMVTLDNTIGALYLGIVFSATFSGITFAQSYNYFVRYPQDWRIHQVSVTALLWPSLMLLDTSRVLLPDS